METTNNEAFIKSELEKLEKYRKLFKLIINQQDRSFHYTVAELEQYYCEIEGLKERYFDPYIIYRDPPREWLDQKINMKSFNDYLAKVNSWDNYKLPNDYDDSLNKINSWDNYDSDVKTNIDPCIVRPLPNGQPDLTAWLDAGPYIIQTDRDGNPVITITTNDIEAR